jgi:diguanylate cyclase (GGDEF)-like protein
MNDKTNLNFDIINENVKRINNFDDYTLSVLAQDTNKVPEKIKQKIESLKKNSKNFYSNLLFAIAGIKFEEKIAKDTWENILKHKFELGLRLGRNVGYKVASFDYLINITGTLKSFCIIDEKNLSVTSEASMRDALTKLYNRGYFQYLLNLYCETSLKNKTKLCLFMFDVDFFKNYNDINGHIAGDMVLIELANLITDVIRKKDIAARYGGEEFIIIYPETCIDEALNISEDLRSKIENYKFPNEIMLPNKKLTISGGISEFPNSDNSPLSLIKNADIKLYRSKNSGKNKITF